MTPDSHPSPIIYNASARCTASDKQTPGAVQHNKKLVHDSAQNNIGKVAAPNARGVSLSRTRHQGIIHSNKPLMQTNKILQGGYAHGCKQNIDYREP